jgi:hypothetical protein
MALCPQQDEGSIFLQRIQYNTAIDQKEMIDVEVPKVDITTTEP